MTLCDVVCGLVCVLHHSKSAWFVCLMLHGTNWLSTNLAAETFQAAMQICTSVADVSFSIFYPTGLKCAGP